MRRRFLATAALVLAGLGLLALLIVWTIRFRIAAGIVDRKLAAAHVPASYQLTGIGPFHERMENVRIGTPQAPDLIARQIDVYLGYGWGGPAVRAIRVEGVRRFNLESTEVQKDQLLVGQVQWLAEQADSPLLEADEDLLALLVALGEHPMVEALDMPRPVDGRQALSNQLAYLLPFMEEDKLDLLSLDSPQERLGEIQKLLERIQGELFA